VLLDNILTHEQEEAGFTVSEDEDVEDIVCLEYRGHILATWISLDVKPAAIRDEAKIYLSKFRGYSRLINTGI
jgi:hypothetical protein